MTLHCCCKGQDRDRIRRFAWTGWDEPGIVIDDSMLKQGMDAAKANLRLAKELDKGDLPLSRAYWMLAGYDLAFGNYADAVAHYTSAVEFAKQADEAGDELLAKAFVALSEFLEKPDDSDKQAALNEAKANLEPLEHGKMFIGQVDAALKVFGQ